MNAILVFVVMMLSIVDSFLQTSMKAHSSLISLQMVKVGEVPPNFELKNFEGKSFSLSSFKGKKPVVVFFYPADSTPGCTAEVCAFEKRAPDFKSKGAEVFGVSSNGAADKEKFVKANKLTSLELLIDEGEKVRKSWAVPRALFGAFPGRVTYVIGKDGEVKSIYDDLANAALHPEKALEVLAKEPSPEPAKKGWFGK